MFMEFKRGKIKRYVDSLLFLSRFYTKLNGVPSRSFDSRNEGWWASKLRCATLTCNTRGNINVPITANFAKPWRSVMVGDTGFEPVTSAV